MMLQKKKDYNVEVTRQGWRRYLGKYKASGFASVIKEIWVQNSTKDNK
jgi:hypothetical protein